MRNPLTTLDELIWQQFEKVTVAAEKRLGWDKWDLADRALKIADGALVGFGTYVAISGSYATGSMHYAVPTLGATLIGSALLMECIGSHVFQKERRREQKLLLQTGASEEPTFSPLRPVGLVSGSALLGWGASLFYVPVAVPKHFQNMSPELYNTMGGMLSILVGTYFSSLTAMSYFQDQLPRPSAAAKKSLWEAITGYITNPFSKKIPAPAEAPGGQ